MAIKEYKIKDADIENTGVVAAPDVLIGNAKQNKMVFDRLIRETVKGLFNGLIDALAAVSGAGEVGAFVDGLSGSSVQEILGSIKTMLDSKAPSADVTAALILKEDKSVTDTHLKSVEFDAESGKFRFIKQSGAVVEIDTALEKVAMNWTYDAATQSLVLTLIDGTTQRVSLSDFITVTEFVSSDSIEFSESGQTVTAIIKPGSITDAMLSSTLVEMLQGYVSAAAASAEAAGNSAREAKTHADNAAVSATTAEGVAEGLYEEQLQSKYLARVIQYGQLATDFPDFGQIAPGETMSYGETDSEPFTPPTVAKSLELGRRYKATPGGEFIWTGETVRFEVGSNPAIPTNMIEISGEMYYDRSTYRLSISNTYIGVAPSGGRPYNVTLEAVDDRALPPFYETASEAAESAEKAEAERAAAESAAKEAMNSAGAASDMAGAAENMAYAASQSADAATNMAGAAENMAYTATQQARAAEESASDAAASAASANAAKEGLQTAERNAAASADAAAASAGNAAASETAAKDAQTAAEKARDEAQSVAGGNFVPTSRTVNGKALSEDVALTAADVGALSTNGGTLYGELKPSGGIAYTGRQHFLAYPSGGTWYLAGAATGYLKIKLPQVLSAIPYNTMLSFNVQIYNYRAGATCEYTIGGFLYTSWRNITAYCVGTSEDYVSNLPVKFCRDGNTYSILIGKPTTVWNHPHVAVKNIQVGHSAYTLGQWCSGWSIGVSADEPEAVDITVENPNLSKRLNAADVGAVPTTRTVNGKALDNDISLTANNVGAMPGLQSCNNMDLNELKTPGFYYGLTMTNGAPCAQSVVEVFWYSNPDWIVQRQTNLSDGKTWIRTFYLGTTWTEWQQVYSSKHKPSASDIGAPTVKEMAAAIAAIPTRLVVTITEPIFGSGVYEADHTFEEMYAAHSAGREVVVTEDGYVFLHFIDTSGTIMRFAYTTHNYNKTIQVTSEDVWSVSETVVAKEIHASQHASDGSDPITPAMIGAATLADIKSAASIAKLKEITTTAETAQIEFDLSDIDLDRYRELTFHMELAPTVQANIVQTCQAFFNTTNNSTAIVWARVMTADNYTADSSLEAYIGTTQYGRAILSWDIHAYVSSADALATEAYGRHRLYGTSMAAAPKYDGSLQDTKCQDGFQYFCAAMEKLNKLIVKISNPNYAASFATGSKLTVYGVLR